VSPRELVVLGTASQVPTKQRNHNGYLLRWGEEGVLFDPGEGTQRQMSYAGVSVTDITRIAVTHFHGDHCLGLPGVIQRINLDRVAHPVDVYYPASGAQYFDRLSNATAFHHTVELRSHPIAGPGPLDAPDAPFVLAAVPLSHPVEAFGYRLTEPDGVRMLPERLRAIGLHGPAAGSCSATARSNGAGAQSLWTKSASRGPGRVSPSSWTPGSARASKNWPPEWTCW
jgi:ribonuclease Z